jgi:CoA-transferase family III
MPNDNIFSGLKVVDLASFIAGPSAAVILSDFGADVIKVEPPNGDLWRIANHLPPQPVSEDAYPLVKKLRLLKGGSVPTFLVLGRCCTTSLRWTLEEGRRGSQAILDTAG